MTKLSNDILATNVAKIYLADTSKSPDLIVAEISIERGLNYNEIKRLIERTNQLIQLKLFEQNKVEFPIIRLENVLNWLKKMQENIEIEEVKSEVSSNSIHPEDWLLDDIDWSKSQEWIEPVQTKLASLNITKEEPKDYFYDSISKKSVDSAVEFLKIAEDEIRVTNMQQRMKLMEIENNMKKIMGKIPPEQLEKILLNEIEKENIKYEDKKKAKSLVRRLIDKVKKTFIRKEASLKEVSEENLKYIIEGINVSEGFKKLAYEKALEEEVENIGSENLYETLTKIANVNYYADKLENDIRNAELKLKVRKQQEKIAMLLETPSITEDQKDILYNVHSVVKNYEKVASITDEIKNKLLLLKTAVDKGLMDEKYFEKIAATAGEKIVEFSIDQFMAKSKKIPLQVGIQGATAGALTSTAVTGGKENRAYKDRVRNINEMYEEGKITKEQQEQRLKEVRKQYLGARARNVTLGALGGGLIAAGGAQAKLNKYQKELRTTGLSNRTINKLNSGKITEEDIYQDVKKKVGKGKTTSSIIGGILGASTETFIPDYYEKEEL
jgi:hypothetical protein